MTKLVALSESAASLSSLMQENNLSWVTVFYDIFKIVFAAAVGYFITKRVAEKFAVIKKNNKHLSDYGIKSIGSHGNANLTLKDTVKLFGHYPYSSSDKWSKELCFFFLTGFNFFNKYQRTLISLANNGTKIKILVADYRDCRLYKEAIKKSNEDDSKETSSNDQADSIKKKSLLDYCTDILSDESSDIFSYYKDIVLGKIPGESFLDRTTAMLACRSLRTEEYSDEEKLVKEFKESIKMVKGKGAGDLCYQVIKLEDRFKATKKTPNLEIAFYKDEYRVPLMISKRESKNSSKKDIVRVWTNIVLPMQESRESINVYAEDIDNSDLSFIKHSVSSFDYVWNKYHNH